LAVASSEALIETLRQCCLLSTDQLDTVVRELQPRFGEPHELARLAVAERRRGWRLYHLGCYQPELDVHFTAVSMENSQGLARTFRDDLSTTEYESALAELKRQGQCPAAVAPYHRPGGPRSTAVWCVPASVP
jgi:hypothetical protein